MFTFTPKPPERQRQHAPAVRRDPDPGGAGLRRQAGRRGRRPPGRAADRPRRAAAARSTRARTSTSWTETARDPRRPELAGRAVPPALADRRCEITGPTSRKMTDQRAELRRVGVDGRLRGRHRAELVQHHRRPDQPVRRAARRRSTSPTSPARSTRSARRRRPIMVRPRGWRLCEKHITADGRPLPASVVDFGLYFFHNAQWLIEQRRRPVLLPAEAGEPPRGAAVERPVHPGAGTAGHPGRHHPGDRADRDVPGRVRDGGDPLRAARPHVRPERRPLGLHLQLHQDVRRGAGKEYVLPDRAADHHDDADDARLHRAAGGHLQAARRPADRRDGRVRADQGRRRAVPRRRWRRSPRTRPARPTTASSAPGWRTRRWCRPAWTRSPDRARRAALAGRDRRGRAGRRSAPTRRRSPSPACGPTSPSRCAT